MEKLPEAPDRKKTDAWAIEKEMVRISFSFSCDQRSDMT